MNGFERAELISVMMVAVGIVGMILYALYAMPIPQ